MKLWHVRVEWKLGGVQQENCLPVWASNETFAVNIARGKLMVAAKVFGERVEIGATTVEARLTGNSRKEAS